MIDLIEIYVHWYAGRSQAQIAQSLGLDRKTVRKYLAPAAAEGQLPGGHPVLTEADWGGRARACVPVAVANGGPDGEGWGDEGTSGGAPPASAGSFGT